MITNKAPIHTIIGGFHLLHASKKRLPETYRALQVLHPQRIIPCHCTGENAFEGVSHVIAESITCGAAGMMINYDLK